MKKSDGPAPPPAPRRARLTRAEAKAQTRRALIDAAAEVFARHGFHGASIDQVAEAAGYTKGAVYAHFTSKEDLYLALLETHLRESGSDLTRKLESGVPVAQLAAEMEQELPRELEATRNWAMLSLEFFLHALRDETVAQRLAELIRHARGEYEETMRRRATAMGGPLPLSAEQLGVVLLALENGLSIFGLLDSRTLENGAYTAALQRLIDPA